MSGVIRLDVQVVAAGDGDAEELERFAGMLRDELLALDVDAVDAVDARDRPAGAKGVGVVAGWLAVQLSSPEMLQNVIAAIGGWAGRADRSVKVKLGNDVLEVHGVTSAQQDKIIEAWIERQSTRA